MKREQKLRNTRSHATDARRDGTPRSQERIRVLGRDPRATVDVRSRKSLSDVEALVLGYYGALSIHGIDEGVPEVASHFASWLRHRFNWSLSCGWAYAITENSSAGQAFDRFFELLDEYGALTPLPLYSVRLRPEHQPTGRRVVIGYGGRMKRPDAIQIVRYHPEPLFFLRFTYGTRTENDNVLFDNGCWATSAEFAKRWVQDELDVAPHEWTPVVS